MTHNLKSAIVETLNLLAALLVLAVGFGLWWAL